MHVYENLVILTVFGTAVKIRSRSLQRGGSALDLSELKNVVDQNASLAVMKLQRHHSTNSVPGLL